ncbi:MAG TPA: nitrous oxide-stimulated promoter family protein [Candidatus Sumerlaeota bacterium]|nr:nitrous oxide-stimulated promoter family protein [Candidatus Sumerlaeota bacterium]HPK03152.1 nitrous oxide-stimulated promoter family protein [Candidatus Sumerlaeota bacterium]
MPSPASRIAREAKTIQVMIAMFCREHHACAGAARPGRSAPLCAGCRELRDYALRRLERCPFQAGKTTCALCPIHCYRADMRERVRAVMRWAGPRMITRHPLLALGHLLDQRRKTPVRAAGGGRAASSSAAGA